MYNLATDHFSKGRFPEILASIIWENVLSGNGLWEIISPQSSTAIEPLQSSGP
jgi:hypothetical protein